MISLVLEMRINAEGSSSLIKLRSRTACGRFSAVKMTYLSFPENAPCAWQTVALRFNSCTIKSQIGFGLSHTTLKYLERLKLSIKVSIINERIASPRNEYSPVAMSNMKQPATVISTSVIKRACPISTLEYFFRIMAMISVPPLEEPMLNRIAEPRDGSAMAKQSSSIG